MAANHDNSPKHLKSSASHSDLTGQSNLLGLNKNYLATASNIGAGFGHSSNNGYSSHFMAHSNSTSNIIGPVKSNQNI
jgi:hypothetical protein